MPKVKVVSAVSLDGKIASRTGYSKLSCPEDLRRLHLHRASVDAVMIGANTAIRDDPMLTVRLVPSERQPIRVIVDGLLRIPTTLRVVKTAREIPTVVLTSNRADRAKAEELRQSSVQVEIFDTYPIDLREALHSLREKYNVSSILVEGGGTLIWSLIRQDLVDEIYLTVTSCIFGSGTSFVEGEGFATCEDSPKFRVKSVLFCSCGREVVIHLIRERST